MNPNTKVTFHHLKSSVYPDQNNQYAIVRWDTDESVKVDQEVVDIIKLFTAGKTLKEVAHETKNNQSDITDIVNTLRESGFVKKINSTVLADTADIIHPWLTNIDRKWFQWLLFKPLLFICFLYIIAGILVGILVPGYFPSYKSYFWTNDYLIVFVSIFLIDIVLLFLHESGHFIATRAIGGQATMRISNRLFFIVAETISYHLAVLPKELRYFVYFGGMFVDFFVIASIYWIFIIADHLGIQLGLLRSFCLIIVLINIKGIVWQYNAFLQTDMYNFLSDFLNQENLQADSKKFLVRKISHWKSPVSIPFRRIMLSTILSKDAISNADDLRMFTKRDRTEFGIYGTILITGVIFLALQFLLYTLPKDITFFIGSGQNIFTGIQNHNILKVLEGILLLILISHPYLLLLYMRIRGKKK